MPQKWTFFAIGAMAGIIAILSFALALQTMTPKAHAQGGADNNPAAGIIVATGGSQQNINDVCWVLIKHPNDGAAAGGGDGTTSASKVMDKKEYLSLACYKVEDNGKKMKLVGIRNITWDIDLIELNNEKPTVMEIIKALKDEEKKKKENK